MSLSTNPQHLLQLEEAISKKLVGKHYVSFKESMVEMKPEKVARRGGPVALSQISENNERSLRGTELFHLWIANKDHKDENSKSVLFREWNKEKDEWVSQYYEYTHDLGFSLGSSFKALEINKLPWQHGFIMNPGKNSPTQYYDYLFFSGIEYYFPSAWHDATFADSIWMTDRLAGLSTEEIAKIVSHSKWPSFLQSVLTAKLVHRAHKIFDYFSPNAQDVKSRFPVPSITTNQSIASIIHEMEASNVSIPNTEALQDKFLAWARHDKRKVMWQNQSFSNMPVQDARNLIKNNWDRIINNKQKLVDDDLNITSCKESYIINFIESEFWPTGFVNRTSRLFDYKERVCSFGDLSKQVI